MRTFRSFEVTLDQSIFEVYNIARFVFIMIIIICVSSISHLQSVAKHCCSRACFFMWPNSSRNYPMLSHFSCMIFILRVLVAIHWRQMWGKSILASRTISYVDYGSVSVRPSVRIFWNERCKDMSIGLLAVNENVCVCVLSIQWVVLQMNGENWIRFSIMIKTKMVY